MSKSDLMSAILNGGCIKRQKTRLFTSGMFMYFMFLRFKGISIHCRIKKFDSIEIKKKRKILHMKIYKNINKNY